MKIVWIGPALLALVACDGAHTPQQHLTPPADPSFTLLVSNQSFELDPVDITIRLDGQLAVTGDFHVEGQHTWIPFEFGLAPGAHTIAVETTDAAATLSQPFTVDDHRWGVVMFWYYPVGSPEPTPPQFSWSVHDQPPAFD